MCVCLGGALCKQAVVALEASAGQRGAVKGLESAGVILGFSPQNYICHLNQTPAQSRGHIYIMTSGMTFLLCIIRLLGIEISPYRLSHFFIV